MWQRTQVGRDHANEVCGQLGSSGQMARQAEVVVRSDWAAVVGTAERAAGWVRCMTWSCRSRQVVCGEWSCVMSTVPGGCGCVGAWVRGCGSQRAAPGSSVPGQGGFVRGAGKCSKYLLLGGHSTGSLWETTPQRTEQGLVQSPGVRHCLLGHWAEGGMKFTVQLAFVMESDKAKSTADRSRRRSKSQVWTNPE